MELLFRKIINKEQDLAGKWRVWIEVADNELMMLKFQTNPNVIKIKETCLIAIENRKLEIKEIIK